SGVTPRASRTDRVVYHQLLFFLSVFFQAEDGIRDFHVTGVQTCALPISPSRSWSPRDRSRTGHVPCETCSPHASPCRTHPCAPRSEERRVGKEWRAAGSASGESNHKRWSAGRCDWSGIPTTSPAHSAAVE